MPIIPHLLISSFHNVSDQFFFISSYYVATYHLSLASLIFSAICSTPPHLLISSFHKAGLHYQSFCDHSRNGPFPN
jgi:hypothetical protein